MTESQEQYNAPPKPSIHFAISQQHINNIFLALVNFDCRIKLSIVTGVPRKISAFCKVA